MSKRMIRAALKQAQQEIAMFSSRGRIAAGLAPEGYHGGYADALMDVLAVLDKVPPSRRPEYWTKEEP